MYIPKATGSVIKQQGVFTDSSYSQVCLDTDTLYHDSLTDKWFYSNNLNIVNSFYHFNRNYALGGEASIGMLYSFLGVELEEEWDRVGYGEELYSSGIVWIDYRLELISRPNGGYYEIIYEYEVEDLWE